MNITLAAILMVSIVILSVFVKKLPMQFTLCIVPVACALLIGYSIQEIGDMAVNSINRSMKAAGYMCFFAMIYFTVLSETGMFSILIKKLLKFSRGSLNVYAVMIMTSAIAAVSMLTATIVTAYLIVFPIMLPIYKKMNFNRKAAMIIAQTSIAAMCFVPWGIAVVNSSVFAGVDAMELSRRLIPVAFCFIPAIVLQWVYFGFKHKKQGGLMSVEWSEENNELEAKADSMERPKYFWINFIFFLAVIALLAANKVPTYLIFIAASFVTIMINYPEPKEYQKLLAKAGNRFYNTMFMLIGISIFIGIFQDTDMVSALATFIVGSFPAFLTRYIHIILAAVMIVVIRFMPNKIYNSMYPVLISIGTKFGLAGTDVIAPFVCNMSLATGSSPFTATTHVGVGLLEIDVDDYCREAVPVQTVTNLVILAAALLTGIVR